jgi:hypothetical protein
MKGIALAATLAIVACGSSASPAATSGTIPPSQGLACRLPVTWTVVNGSVAASKAGFWSYPNGPVTEDQAAPAGSQFFDAAHSRWLSAPREAVSPNGDQYAYTDGSTYLGIQGHVHVVDLSTNADRVIYSGVPYRVVDFAPEGIYLTADMGEGPNEGLWLMNPGDGGLRLINKNIRTPAVGAGAGWGEDLNPADPSPPPGIASSTNRVVRVDLVNGSVTPWFYTQGAQPTILGVDGRGNPFVRVDRQPQNDPDVNHDTNEVWLVTSQTSASRLFSGVSWNEGPWRLAATDGLVAWFDGSGGIWLYSQSAIRLVAKPGLGQLAVAGGCLKAS